jgi:hypothetical protein
MFINLDLNRGLAYSEELEELDFSKILCGLKTLQGYVTAICELYTTQKDFENNPHPHPRTNVVKNLIESVKKTTNNRKDESYSDRLKDIITFSDYMKNATFLGLDMTKSESTRIALRLDVLMMYSCMARSQFTRGMCISEVGVENVSLRFHENSDHKAIRLTTKKGKKKQFEQAQYVGIMR